MVNYSNSKILLFYNTQNPTNTLLASSTSDRIRAKNDLIKQSKLDKKGKLKSFFDSLCDSKNLACKIITEAALENVGQLKSLLDFIIKKTQQPIRDTIKLLKPDISDVTLTRYEKNYLHLQKHFENNMFFWCDAQKVIEHLTTAYKSIETRKNYLKAIISTLNPVEKVRNLYSDELMKIGNEIQKHYDDNLLSQHQLEKWVSYDKVLDIYKQLEQSNTITSLPSYIIANFYAGKYFAPYRSMELINLKYKDYNPETDNYIDWKNNTIVLNIYKTKDAYGRIVQKIPAQFKSLLKKYVEHNQSPYVLETDDGKQLTYYQLNRKINSIFGCSINILRHSYVTHLYDTGKLRTNTQIKKVARELRNSPQMTLEYRKILAAGVQQPQQLMNDDDN
jgi:integrase